MKKLSSYLLIIITIVGSVFFFNSCKKKSTEVNPEFAKYISAFSYGRISSGSDINIELTQDLPSVELDKEIEDELFEFSPLIKGSAYWTSTRNIKFVPEPGQLHPGQEYTATFKLGKVLKVPSEFEEFNFSFHIPAQGFNISIFPYSPMKDNDLHWNSVEGTITLADNIDLEKVKSMLSLKNDEKGKATITINPSILRGKYDFKIENLYRGDKDMTYTLHVDGSPISAKQTEDFVIELPAISNKGFEIIDYRVVHEPSEGIRITFSNPLSLNQNIQGLVKPKNISNFSYDINKNVLTIYLENYTGNSNVEVEVFKQLKDADNKNLIKNYTLALSYERNKPAIEVLNSGNILPNSSNLIIPFKATSLWAVDVKVIKIFQSNILGYLQANDMGETSEIKRFGRLILKKRIRLDEDPSLDLNTWNNFSLDLSKLIEQDPGSLYRVSFSMKLDYSMYDKGKEKAEVTLQTVSSNNFGNQLTDEDMAEWDIPGSYYYENYYDWSVYSWDESDDPTTVSYYMGSDKTSSCTVLASNIGMTAKLATHNKLLVVANNIVTTEPLANTQIDVYNYQMQKIGSGTTSNDGMVEISYKGGVPFVVIATNGKEKGYLKVSSNLSLSLSNFDVSGRELPKGLKGYIYGERGVWRPGDDIFLTFIIEDKDNILPKDHPVELEFYNPRGQLHNRTIKTDGQNGFYSFKLSTNEKDETGNWQVNIKVGGVSFSKNLRIETVKPNRLKIRLDAGEIIDASKGTISASINSQWLHGAPASNLKAKVEMTLSNVGTPFKGYEKYTFNNPTSRFTTDTYTLFDGGLDASGKATFTSKLPQAASAPGLLKANFVSRVFENGGDASIYAQMIPYSPYSSYVGVKIRSKDETRWLETDTDNPIDIVTVNKDGKPTNRSKLDLKIYKIGWSWWWSRSNEDLSSYVNSTSTEVVLHQTVSTTGGKASVNFKIEYPNWGRYLVMVRDPESGHSTGKIIYVDWPYWRGRSNKQDPSGLTMLSFNAEKQAYKVGDDATIIIPKSSKGRALITLEQGSKILSRGWVETSSTEDTKHTFKVTEDMAPNFYVSVHLYQPHGQEANDLPIRMYGIINLNVENEATILKPVIEMPDQLRPEQEFTVKVSEKNKRDMTYTLAIVDEGLLDLTAFRTPNAWNDFYARQSLSVRTWDMYDLVVGAKTGKMGPLLSIGGDEALNPNNKTMSRFKPVVKFLGPFTLKAGKTDSHKITLPPYFGSVRTMVVAGNDKGGYGNTEKAVQVKNPLMVLSTLPRVAGPDEEILLPVNIFAMDKKVKDVKITVQSSGLFQFTDGNTQSVTFTEEGDKTINFKTKVANKTGFDKITIKATGGGESVTETIDIEVRNPNPQIILSDYTLVESKSSADLKIKLDEPKADDWVKMEISRMPAINLNQNIAYLLQYPHGCSEQVTSKVLPLLYIQNFKTLTNEEKKKFDFNINEGIKILMARQLSSGGFMYWPGDSYPTEWVTTYVGHFLIEAKRAGYDVPNSVITKWQNFQKRSAQTWNQKELYNSYYYYRINDLQQAYRLYTLALSGNPELGSMNRLKESKDLSIQARWRLAAAYMLAGKKDAAKQVIANSSDKVDKYSFNNNTYGSASRDMAMIMETHLLMGNIDKAIELATTVSRTLNRDYISTQDAAFGLMAMSKLAKEMGKGVIAYDWKLNDKIQAKENNGQVFQEKTIPTQQDVNVNFVNNGEGKLFVRLLGKTQPMGDKVPAQEGEDVKLIVRYIDEKGNTVNVSKLKQGAEFFAEAYIQNISGTDLTDLAITQIFASGWEIFNERLFDPKTDNGSLYNHQDIRDDRVMTYFNLRSNYNTTVKVRLQAAYCGRFYLPGVSCETMYNPKAQSRTAGQWVEVVK